MAQDNVVIPIKLFRITNKSSVNNEILDYQEQILKDMERQLEAAENLELVSDETLIHWRDILHREQQSIWKHKSRFSR
jgi:hypothetical protein